MPGGNYKISDVIDLRGKPVATIGEDAQAGYRTEVGYRKPVGEESRTLDAAFIESIAQRAIQLMGDEEYRRHLASAKKSSASATPKKHHHRLVELVEYAHDVTTRIDTAQGDAVDIDGDLLSELIILVDLFERWNGHPGLSELRKTLTNSTDVQHSLVQLSVASYLADNDNGVGIIFGPQPPGRIPDLYILPTYTERLNVEVKTPIALRKSNTPPIQTELLKIIEGHIDKAASTKRGQLNPKETGVLVLGAFHLRPVFIDNLEQAVASVLGKQQARKPHLLAVIVGVVSYQVESILDARSRVIAKSFVPSIHFRIVRHPGYKGALTLSG